jgi:hypothetical protein
MTVAATYIVDAKEHYRALRAMMRNNPARWLAIVMGTIVPAIAIWTFVVRDWDRLSPMGILLNGGPWILISGFYLFLLPLMLRSVARRATREEPALRGEQARILSADGLEARGHNFLQRLPWADIRRSVETPEFFLFFYNRRQAYYVPKRSLSEPDIATVRAIIQSHAPVGFTHRETPA